MPSKSESVVVVLDCGLGVAQPEEAIGAIGEADGEEIVVGLRHCAVGGNKHGEEEPSSSKVTPTELHISTLFQ
jgi:hypothetical protein